MIKIFGCKTWKQFNTGPARAGRLLTVNVCFGKTKIFSPRRERFSGWKNDFLGGLNGLHYTFLYNRLYTWKSIEISYKLQCQVYTNTKSKLGSDIISYNRSGFPRKFFSNRWTQRDYFGLASSKALCKRLAAVNNWVAISCFSPNKFPVLQRLRPTCICSDKINL